MRICLLTRLGSFVVLAANSVPGLVVAQQRPNKQPVDYVITIRTADQYSGADAGDKIRACLADLPASGGICDARGLEGVQTASATITIPSKATLLLGAVTLTTSARPGIQITPGSAGTSGKLIGLGDASVINYIGIGHAVQAYTEGAQYDARVEIESVRIVGTSSGLSGVRLVGYNGTTMRNVTVTGFSAGDGFRSEGANEVDCYSCISHGNSTGVHNLTRVIGTTGPVRYASNAIHFFGGDITGNSNWGVYEDPTGRGGTNLGNAYIGVNISENGSALAPSKTGDIFIQEGDGTKIVANYFEVVAGTPHNDVILLGDSTHSARQTEIRDNTFLSVPGTQNTIHEVYAYNTTIDGNHEEGQPTNFINHEPASRGLWVGSNSAPGAAHYFAGSDAGSDSIVLHGTNQTNAWSNTPTGLAFNSISGLYQDLVIRARFRAGATHIVNFNRVDGANVAFIDLAGKGQFDGGLEAGASGTGLVHAGAIQNGGSNPLAVPSPATPDTLVARSTPDALTNKTITLLAVTFVNLPAKPSDGTFIYCSNCLKGSNPCSGSSTGTFAYRVNGVWICF